MIFQFYFSLFLSFFVCVYFLSFSLGNRISMESLVKRLRLRLRFDDLFMKFIYYIFRV